MGRTNKSYLLTTAAALVATGFLMYVFSTKKDERSTKENHDSDEVTVLISDKDDVTTKSSASSSLEELLLTETPVRVESEHNVDHIVPEPLILTETLETTETILPTAQGDSVEVKHQGAQEAFESIPVSPIIESDKLIPQTRDVLDTPVHIENATPRDAGNEELEQAPLASNATAAGSALSTSPAAMMKNLHLRRKHKTKKVPNAQVASVQKSLKDFRAAEGKKKKTKATSTTQ
ncbi:hypothetical protein MHU86_24176 [Fragilaria crotonensis]|nr:hypothetical protein MHU86_24176 [Fragilaria crotonensis]